MRRTALPLALVWLTAFNLRVIMFAIPPSLPAIRSSLGLSYTATGSITSLMVLTLGLASIPGALLTSRHGSRRLVAVCGFALVVSTVSLTLPPAAFWVFAGSAFLAISIALAQPPLTILVRRWFPTRITRAANLYGNGLLIGNVVGATLAPYLIRLIGWRWMFLLWAAVAVPGVLLWVRFAPPGDQPTPRLRLASLLRDPRVWQVAGLFTFQNLAFYTVATWMPFLLSGRSTTYVAVAFLFLNCIPTVPLLLLALLRWQYALSTSFYALAGLLTAGGSLGMLLGLTDFVWPLAFLVGLGAAAAFIGSLALPALLAAGESEAAGFTAVMFAAGYLLAFVGPLGAGFLVDGTHQVTAAFWPAVLSGLVMAVLGALLPRLLVRARAAAAA